MLQRSIAMNGGVQCSNSTMLKSSFPFLHDGTLPVVTYHIPRRLCNLSFEQALVVDPHPLILSTFNTIVPCEKWKKSKSLFHVFVKILVLHVFVKSMSGIFLDYPGLHQNPLWRGFAICQKYKVSFPV